MKQALWKTVWNFFFNKTNEQLLYHPKTELNMGKQS